MILFVKVGVFHFGKNTCPRPWRTSHELYGRCDRSYQLKVWAISRPTVIIFGSSPSPHLFLFIFNIRHSSVFPPHFAHCSVTHSQTVRLASFVNPLFSHTEWLVLIGFNRPLLSARLLKCLTFSFARWLFLTKLSFVLALKLQGRCLQFKFIWDL